MTLDADGTIHLHAGANYNGDRQLHLHGERRHGGRTRDGDVTVTGVNDAPVAVDDAATTAEDTAVSGTVLANDTDLDGGRR